MRIEDRAEDLRNGLLHQPIQHTRHPQQPFSAAGLGNCYPTNRQRPVDTRVQRLPHLRPMINEPRTQIFRAHPVDPGRTTIGLDTFQRRRQVLPGKHQLPKAPLLAVNDLPGARRDITTLCCGLRRTHRLLPLQARRSGMAAITVTSTSKHHDGRSTSRSVLPRPTTHIPWPGTTTSADFCPVSPRLTTQAVNAPTNTVGTDDTRDRPPRVRTTAVPVFLGAAFTQWPHWR